MKMTDCYFETKDWRKCKDEVGIYIYEISPLFITDILTPEIQMETFRRCWKSHGNDERTSTKDSDKTVKS